jgi:hypothetical protein
MLGATFGRCPNHEKMPMEPDCAHSWKPVPGWYGRYRCEWCRALAYRNLVNLGARGKQHQMRLYICERKDCERPAVSHREVQLCRDHYVEWSGKERED